MKSFCIDSNKAIPPIAKKIPKTDSIHGETRIDDYFWLRDKTNAEVINYLDEENAYTDTVLKPTEAFQEKLYKEIKGRIKETDLSVPFKMGDYFYYSRTEEGKQYNINCRKKGSLESSEEVVLDLNQLAEGKKFMSLGEFSVSDNAELLAYSTDETGFRQYTLQIKNLKTGETLTDNALRVTSAEWAADNQTLFYVQEDDVTKRSCKVFKHVLGSANDELIYEEKDELYDSFIYRSHDKKFLFIGVASKETTEMRFLAANNPNGKFQLIEPRKDDREYFVEHRENLFYIRTNDDAKNFKLVTAPESNPEFKNWTDLIAHRSEITLQNVEIFKNYLVLNEREHGLTNFRVLPFDNNFIQQSKSYRIEFPEPVYEVFSAGNAEFETDMYRFSYQSLVTPNSVFDFDLKTKERKLMKEQEVVGGYDKSQYKSERIFATASDGTKIPISIIFKKNVKLDGTTPLYLYGYGSYGVSIPASFSVARLSVLDRGLIYAIAHIRGGGELGETWHDDGKMMHKKNTFTDFISCAEHLIHEKYTLPSKLVCEGGSAGGLLIGAVINMRPDLFRAAHLAVPFVDVINTMLDSSLPLTVSEYLEWGNPNEKAAYDYMKSYSPYDNIADKPYPHMLITTSLNDSQVMYWEPAKYTAKLRATKTNQSLVLLKTNMDAGHGGASGRYDRLKEIAFEYAFFFNLLGIHE